MKNTATIAVSRVWIEKLIAVGRNLRASDTEIEREAGIAFLIGFIESAEELLKPQMPTKRVKRRKSK